MFAILSRVVVSLVYSVGSRVSAMATPETPKGPFTPGELLRQLREERKINSAREMARRTGLSHTLHSEQEKALGPINMQGDTARRIARATSVPMWLIDKIASGAIDELPDNLDELRAQALSEQRSLSERQTRGRIQPVRFLGSVSAGLDGDGVADAIDYLGVADYFLGDYNPEDLYLLEVTGDSMVSDDARQYVPPGSIIIVHERLEPLPGQVIVAWLENEDMGVLKVYEEKDGETWLLSYNSNHAPIRVTEETPASLRGVMVANWTKAPGFRRVP